MAIRKASMASKVGGRSDILDQPRGKSKRRYPPQKCKYCHGMFVPFQAHQEFCTPSHRKLFWKYGTLPYEKLALKLEARLEEIIAPLRARVEALENANGLRGAVDAARRFTQDVLNAGSERTA